MTKEKPVSKKPVFPGWWQEWRSRHLGKPVIEAYIGTLIERVFLNNAEIRFCQQSDCLSLWSWSLLRIIPPTLPQAALVRDSQPSLFTCSHIPSSLAISIFKRSRSLKTWIFFLLFFLEISVHLQPSLSNRKQKEHLLASLSILKSMLTQYLSEYAGNYQDRPPVSV